LTWKWPAPNRTCPDTAAGPLQEARSGYDTGEGAVP
jgi:hypothetical protein